MVSLSNNRQGNINITTNNDTDIDANTNGNSQRAKSWAVGEGLIDGVDYSAKYYAGQAKESEEIAKRSIQSEDNAHIWAEGTDEEVQALGGEHSSKGWVDYVMENAPTAEIEQTETGATITVTDIHGTTTADILNGAKGDTGATGQTGATGNGISNVFKISTVGLVDTYRMLYTNGSYFDYTVTNGKNGTGSVADVQVNGVSVLTDNVANIDLTNYVTTNTAQDVSGRKTFLGEKAIYFKQSATTNKLGFTLYNPSDTELGAFEWRPSTISGGALLNINVPYSSSNYVGFRYWGTAVNVIAPKVATAGNYYIPTHITNGSTTVTATNAGVVDISTLLPDVSNFVTNTSLATTLSSYATQQWVGNQGYLTSASLSTLTDVTLSNPTQGQNLTYDAITGKWKNTSTTATVAWGGITGTLADQTDLNTALSGKQATLVSGTNIKTINSTSLLGSGNIEVLQNTANHDNSLCIYGTLVSGMSSTEYGTAVGYGTRAGVYSNAFGKSARATGSWAEAFGGNCNASGNWSVVVGHNNEASGNYSTALGSNAKATATRAIQLGEGTNSTASSLQIGFGTNNNYTLLDGTTGLIPDGRISSNIARTSAIPDISTKQDTLVSGTNIKTINNESILGSGNISLAEDDTTISKNSDDELQTIGVIDDNVQNAYNFTVVGSPTITDDGIASGFSRSNYPKADVSITPVNRLVIKSRIIYNTSGNTSPYPQAKIFFGTNYNDWRLTTNYGDNIQFASNDLGNIYLNIGTMADGDIIDTELIITTTSVTVNAIHNGAEFTKTQSKNVTFGLISDLVFGNAFNGSNYFFTGSIDLKQFSITVDGVEVYRAWQPPALKYWTGTKAQYDAIATKDTNTLYNIEGVGLYKGTTLISNDGANIDLSNLSTTGQAVIDAKVNNDDYYYKSGDTVTNLEFFGGGVLTSSGKEIDFNVPLPKSLKNITTITCTALSTGFRKTAGGYMPSNAWNALANATVTISKQSDNMIRVAVTYNNYGGTNNTPVGVWASISLSFT